MNEFVAGRSHLFLLNGIKETDPPRAMSEISLLTSETAMRVNELGQPSDARKETLLRFFANPDQLTEIGHLMLRTAAAAQELASRYMAVPTAKAEPAVEATPPQLQ